MSWHFSLGLEEEYLVACSSGGAQYVPWKSMPIAPDDFSSARMRAIFHRSPFGMMFVPSMDARGAALLTWYQAVFLAKTSAERRTASGGSLKKKRKASTERGADFFSKPFASLMRLDRSSACWKTLICSLTGGLTAFSGPWPKSGTMRSGQCWAQKTLELPICVREPGFSHITPIAADSKIWSPGIFKGMFINQVHAKFFPTAGNLYLNPECSESVMGWPVGWAGRKPLAMARFRSWLRWHGMFFTKG